MNIELLAEKYEQPIIVQPPDAPHWRVALMKLPGALSVSGKGFDTRSARLSCLGEAAELLSCQRRDSDAQFHSDNIKTGTISLVQADVATTMDRSKVDDVGNEGCAAGTSVAEAQRGALMERVERHALARWWLEESAPREPSAKWSRETGLTKLIADARSGSTTVRKTSFLLLEDVGLVSTVIAYSTDEHGRSPIIGVAAEVEPRNAAIAALSELFQMEFALFLARMSAQNGDVRPHNHALLRRVKLFEGAKAHLLKATQSHSPADAKIVEISDIAEKIPGDILMVDLTRPDIGVPVVRAVTPHLKTTRWMKFEPDGGPL